MSDFPKSVKINEEGPREGFQIESGPIPTARKIEFIEALSGTGLKHIQIVSFVNPKKVPGMADAEEVVRGFRPAPGIKYTGLWLNEKGLERARATGKLTLEGKISIYASEKFSMRNNNRNTAQEFEYAHRVLDQYKEHGIPVERASVAAAFGRGLGCVENLRQLDHAAASPSMSSRIAAAILARCTLPNPSNASSHCARL